MLQIATGKLFSSAVERENQLRGVLYTNVHLENRMDPVVTGELFGRLAQATEVPGSPKLLVWEFVERIEVPESGPSVLISHCADSYVQDMATILSFAFNCTCSPDIEIVRRLTSGKRGVAAGLPPNRLVMRAFDAEVWCQPGESAAFTHFYSKLIGLHRKTFLGVMRAIRTYVTGMQRMADDLELAYTLLVAACESLAQDFDGYETTWDAVEQKKRLAIDKALVSASSEVAEAVRAALLSTEHPALRRRFQAFVESNVNPDYFRSGFAPGSQPVGRCDLPEALEAAYKARSLYVHRLFALPDMVTLDCGYSESVLVERSRMLTLQGLSRLVRHVIMTFIAKQPSVEKEPYQYQSEAAGVIQVPLTPNFWVWRAQGDISSLGRQKLEGFLEELALVELGTPGATVTDLTEVLQKFSLEAPQMAADYRRPYLALLMLFNKVVGPKGVPRTKAIEKDIQGGELSKKSSEALVTFALFKTSPDWSIEDHERTLKSYFNMRTKKSGLRLPRLFEAAVTIELAERHRANGTVCRAQDLIVMASDNYPEHEQLRLYADRLVRDSPLHWRHILLPAKQLAD